MIRTLIVIVACLVATELAFGEVHTHLCYNTQSPTLNPIKPFSYDLGSGDGGPSGYFRV